MTGSMIVKPTVPGTRVPWPHPERRTLAPEGERVPLSHYWLRLANKGAVLVVTEIAKPTKAKE